MIFGGLPRDVRVCTRRASFLARSESAISVSRNQEPMRRKNDGFGGLGWAPRDAIDCATLVRLTRWPIDGVAGRLSRGP